MSSWIWPTTRQSSGGAPMDEQMATNSGLDPVRLRYWWSELGDRYQPAPFGNCPPVLRRVHRPARVPPRWDHDRQLETRRPKGPREMSRYRDAGLWLAGCGLGEPALHSGGGWWDGWVP